MKRKIIIGSILAAFLMISIAFIQPVTARGREPVDLMEYPEFDMQEVETLVEMISSDKQVLSLVEPLLQNPQINCILEQMQVATGPDEMFALLTELETVLMDMDLDPEIGNLLMERYGTDIPDIIKDYDDGGWIYILLGIIINLIGGLIAWLIVIFWP